MKLGLSGLGDWENNLQVLRDEDIRGYQDPNCLVLSKGRRCTLEDDQVEFFGAQEASQTDLFTLFVEMQTRRDGTGETRQTLSWIWSTSQGTDDPNKQNDELMCVEWAKSRARAHRCKGNL